ncbi:Dabb family protein [Leifsonia shinshuensis]|uniref:Dabb family protein n=1 Tax=Leifsonia shinshuensis TaxID=150026 RepID=UPI001F507DDE|nr:Dabb family protein [Leifsonia shinshuensis]MCI0156413.1 Dabb family protein [Leifsonia shinshuensis]
MITHTVTFRLAHDRGSAAERDFLDTARHELSAIDGVRDFTINDQVGAKSDLTLQFSMAFADQTAYDAYNAHPAHVAFVRERWVPEVVEFQEFDYVRHEG